MPEKEKSRTVRPSLKAKATFDKLTENHGNMYKSMVESGYSPMTAKKPTNLTESKGWKKLMSTYISDSKLAQRHSELLDSARIEHMVFPLGMSDGEIKELLGTVNCTAKKFRHSNTQTHVWFWSPDNKARATAIDLGYKVSGKYAVDNLNVFIPQQIIINEQSRNQDSNPAPETIPSN